MKNAFFLSCLFISIMMGCGQSSRNAKNDSPELSDNVFLGVWQSVERSYPFGATLKIDSTYYFTYAGGACLYHFESQGEWRLNGDTLILNSFYPEKCCYINDFGINCIIVAPDGSTRYKPITSMRDCTPDSEVEYILFNNERFVLENSILTHIRKANAPCPDIKDNFTRQSNTTEK